MKNRVNDSWRWGLPVASLLLGWVGLFSPQAMAQIRPEGTIREDVVWRGEVVIASDVHVVNAAVRVAPGTVIRFEADSGDGVGPTLFLNSPSLMAGRTGQGSRLILEGTPQAPIVVESAERGARGAIVSGTATSGSIFARHVVFRRLGSPISAKLYNPGILLQLSSADNDLWLSECTFEDCGPLRAEFFGPGASVELTRCTFTRSSGGTALMLAGTGSGIKVIRDNIFDAGVRLETPQLLIQGNVMIGESAEMTISHAGVGGIRLVENYFHCTTTDDVGRYTLKCDTPGVVAERNVLIGGTYVVESSPAQMLANVLVGVGGLHALLEVPGLEGEPLPKTTSTHYLLTNLPPQAVIRDNFFLGPAYAAISCGRLCEQPIIEHNLFDGWNQAGRAVHFGSIARQPIQAKLWQNVITRYTLSPVFDETGRPDTLAQVGENLFAEVFESPYEGVPSIHDLASSDRRRQTFGHLRMAAPATTQISLDVGAQLVQRQVTPRDVWQQWVNLYRARSNSPLIADPPKESTGPHFLSTQPFSAD